LRSWTILNRFASVICDCITPDRPWRTCWLDVCERLRAWELGLDFEFLEEELKDNLARLQGDTLPIPTIPAPEVPPDDEKRRCYQRDHTWLDWNEKLGLTPAKIRDRWNKEQPGQSVGDKRKGREVVRKGIEQARRDREQRP
jgi:hypothetical protein